MKNNIFIIFILLNFFTYGQKEYYEVRKYELPFNSPEEALHKYFSEGLLPALNRNGIQNIGVFEALIFSSKTFCWRWTVGFKLLKLWTHDKTSC